MKDQEARQTADEAKRLATETKAAQEAFRQELIAIVEAALKPVAMQAANALQEVTRARELVESLQEQIEVLASESNANRVDINGLIEANNALTQALTQLVGNLKTAVEPFSTDEKRIPVAGQVPAPLNRETRRRIERR